MEAINEVKAAIGSQPQTLPPYIFGPWDYLGFYDFGSDNTLTSILGTSSISSLPTGTVTGALGNSALTTPVTTSLVDALNDLYSLNSFSDTISPSGFQPLGYTALSTFNSFEVMNQLYNAIGNVELMSSAKTLSGAINEIETAGWITNTRVGENTISGSGASELTNNIVSGSISTEDIASSAIRNAQIYPGAVTNSKIAVNTIRGSVAVSGLTVNNIAAGSISTGDIADGAITYPKLSISSSIINSDISSSAAIDYSKLNLSGSIQSADIADGAIINTNIASGAIHGSGAGAASVGTNNIAAQSIGSGDQGFGKWNNPQGS